MSYHNVNNKKKVEYISVFVWSFFIRLSDTLTNVSVSSYKQRNVFVLKYTKAGDGNPLQDFKYEDNYYFNVLFSFDWERS